jgi:hypothetical protein
MLQRRTDQEDLIQEAISVSQRGGTLLKIDSKRRRGVRSQASSETRLDGWLEL